MSLWLVRSDYILYATKIYRKVFRFVLSFTYIQETKHKLSSCNSSNVLEFDRHDTVDPYRWVAALNLCRRLHTVFSHLVILLLIIIIIIIIIH